MFATVGSLAPGIAGDSGCVGPAVNCATTGAAIDSLHPSHHQAKASFIDGASMKPFPASDPPAWIGNGSVNIGHTRAKIVLKEV